MRHGGQGCVFTGCKSVPCLTGLQCYINRDQGDTPVAHHWTEHEKASLPLSQWSTDRLQWLCHKHQPIPRHLPDQQEPSDKSAKQDIKISQLASKHLKILNAKQRWNGTAKNTFSSHLQNEENMFIDQLYIFWTCLFSAFECFLGYFKRPQCKETCRNKGKLMKLMGT